MAEYYKVWFSSGQGHGNHVGRNHVERTLSVRVVSCLHVCMSACMHACILYRYMIGCLIGMHCAWTLAWTCIAQEGTGSVRFVSVPDFSSKIHRFGAVREGVKVKAGGREGGSVRK